jgi:hemerythrin-like domain-containing protein
MDPIVKSEVRSLRSLMLDEHVRLDTLVERLFAAVVNATEGVAKLWSEFDVELRKHLELEEERILPAFSHAYPTEAVRIEIEHAKIREALLELGAAVDSHEARTDMLAQFVDLLQKHTLRENAFIYRWSDEQLELHARSTMLERLAPHLHGMPPASATPAACSAREATSAAERLQVPALARW